MTLNLYIHPDKSHFIPQGKFSRSTLTRLQEYGISIRVAEKVIRNFHFLLTWGSKGREAQREVLISHVKHYIGILMYLR